jgi:maltodextrin utilization protein YvdJ
VTELHTKVDELKLHNDYQLKLKEMNYSEKVKEVTDKFVQELEQAKTKLELLLEEKNDALVEYVERSRVVEEKHQHEVQEIETGYQMKIMELVDAYQQLIRERLEGMRR